PAEETTEEPASEPEEEQSLEEIFSLRPEVLENVASTDEEEDESTKDGAKKNKKKSKHVEVTYDPDKDLTFARKKHKRGDDNGWDWDN
ncbi:MAG: hypothetical protein GYA58_10180, partial [Anaerolineaceae bacterium]|nr:hypothetical protein [Anaerolineaceae bacterium]